MALRPLAAASAAALLLAGCNASGNPFSNPFGSSQPRPQPVAPQPAPQTGTLLPNPTVTINATPARVQETIEARAKRRNTTVLGATATGVTLEIPLRQSSDPIVQQCGAHRDGRALRVYLETVPDGRRTIVTEQKFVVDGTNVCSYAPNEGDVAESNRSLADLKRDAEGRTAAASPNRPADPDGGVEALDPRRPVRPLQ